MSLSKRVAALEERVERYLRSKRYKPYWYMSRVGDPYDWDPGPVTTEPSADATERAREAVDYWFKRNEPENDRSCAAPPNNFPELKVAVARAIDEAVAEAKEKHTSFLSVRECKTEAELANTKRDLANAKKALRGERERRSSERDWELYCQADIERKELRDKLDEAERSKKQVQGGLKATQDENNRLWRELGQAEKKLDRLVRAVEALPWVKYGIAQYGIRWREPLEFSDSSIALRVALVEARE